MKIVAITVTYNSSISLENTIKYLLKQTIELDAIVIVDNCSDEENRSRVKAFGMQSSKMVTTKYRWSRWFLRRNEICCGKI